LPPFATGSVPVTPVVRGNPVALVRLMADGVPRAGVTRVGDVLSTLDPVPVEVVTPVPPFATGSVPVTPVVRGNPVALVSVHAGGVQGVASAIEILPDVVMGLPVKFRHPSADTSPTLVTAPPPPPDPPGDLTMAYALADASNAASAATRTGRITVPPPA
jgi:hypothetical protein